MSCNNVDEKFDIISSHHDLFAKNDTNLAPQKLLLSAKFHDALAASKKAWERIKKESRNTYSYQLESGIPGWTPNRYQTIIEVEQGAFAGYTIRPLGGSINNEMRKHFPVKKTLDELYDECENKIIPHLLENQWFVLDFFANGLLASCSYDSCGLADSEGAGITLNALALERTKNFAPEHSLRRGRLKHDCK